MSYTKNSVEEFVRKRNCLKEELTKVTEQVSLLRNELGGVKNNEEYVAVCKKIASLWSADDGALTRKAKSLDEKISKCNTEIMLRKKKDMVEHYMVIISSINSAYELLLELPENTEKANELEELLTELEQGLSSAVSEMLAEGAGQKDIDDYHKNLKDA